MFEFLCPNGHCIRCSETLVGKAAKCPKCGAKFRIPDPQDLSVRYEQTAGAPPPEVPTAEPDSNSGLDWGLGSAGKERHTDSGLELASLPPRQPDSGSMSRGPVPDSVPPLVRLIEKLLAEKAADGALELDLAGGEILRPDRFSNNFSLPTHGTFFVRESDGTFTAHVIRWEAILRIRLAGLKEIPLDLAEET
ncbi:MAG: hypothetical protein JXB10_14555 [Pirellulales bacterium]|nr:hypothetical protein [Pirellulales bacterium]